MGLICLVPRPQYFAAVIRFGSRGPGRKVWPRLSIGNRMGPSKIKD